MTGNNETRSRQAWLHLTRTYRQAVAHQLSRYRQDRSWPARLQRLGYRWDYQWLPHYFQAPPRWRLWLRGLAGPRVLPDFACVGAAKSGTSDVSLCLLQHPAILPPLSKEIPEVERRYWPAYYPTRRQRAEAVRRHGKALCGIFATRLHQAIYAEELHHAAPDARVVIVLRDPVDRAYSHYKWDLFLGGQTLRPYGFYQSFESYIDAALSLFPGTTLPSRCGQPLLPAGIYARSVRLWLERFGRENVYFLKAEDFFQDPAAAVCGVHEFLGLPPAPPAFTEVVLKNPISVPPPEERTREKLRRFYRPWNQELYEVAGRDFGWG